MATTQAISAADAILSSSPLRPGESATVLIPLAGRRCAIGFVRQLANASVAAVVFGPAAVLSSSDAAGLVEPWNPSAMRKMIASDLPLRAGSWQLVDAAALGSNVSGMDVGCAEFLQEIANGSVSQTFVVHPDRPAPDLQSHETAAPVYLPAADVTFERALGHLLGESIEAESEPRERSGAGLPA